VLDMMIPSDPQKADAPAGTSSVEQQVVAKWTGQSPESRFTLDGV
jgi:hypothetical protein